MTRRFAWSSEVGRGGVEPPTIRFSGLGDHAWQIPRLAWKVSARLGRSCVVSVRCYSGCYTTASGWMLPTWSQLSNGPQCRRGRD